MKLVSLSAIAFSVCASAQADFVGGGVVSLDSWNVEASTEIGSAVTVYRVYLAFDGVSETVDRVNSIFDANFSAGGSLYQDAFEDTSGVHPNGAFIALQPSLAWDSFVSINTRSSNDGAAVAPDPSFQSNGFTDTGVVGGWFLAGSAQGQAGNNPEGTDFGTGLNLVLIGQFTVMGAGRAGDIISMRTDGFLGDGGVFTGQMSIGVNSQDMPFIQNVMFDIPAPGTGAVLFGLAGIAARRRRH